MKKISILFLILLLSFFISCSKTDTISSFEATTKTQEVTTSKVEPYDIISAISLDKSMYHPDSSAKVTVSLNNNFSESKEGSIRLSLLNIMGTKLSTSTEELVIGNNEEKLIEIEITTPNEDYVGYVVLVEFIDRDVIVDAMTSAMDVSSDYTVYPRYGYLTSYDDYSEEYQDTVLERLKNYHINMLQYYDWQDSHDDPLPLGATSWQELALHDVYLSTLEYYIEAAHNLNIVSFNYNLLYGAYESSLNVTVSTDWALYNDSSITTIDYHSLPSSWETTKLYLMNPANPFWQDSIINKEILVYETLGFDGWHIDQLGDRGFKYDVFGNRIDLALAYIDFIHALESKSAMNYIFNAVDGYGQSLFALEDGIDVLYQEIWSKNTYNELKLVIDSALGSSNFEKSIVIAAYMNYDSSSSVGYFNTPSILLTDAVIFASGGSHIELGDTGMLGNEYFLNDNLKMSPLLETKLHQYYDFMVAYENILRGGLRSVYVPIVIKDQENSYSGSSNKIWNFVKENDDYTVIHLINLIGNENDWRDNDQTKIIPSILTDQEITITLNYLPNTIYITSPDFETITPIRIDYTFIQNGSTYEITFSMPSFQYWNMVILEK